MDGNGGLILRKQKALSLFEDIWFPVILFLLLVGFIVHRWILTDRMAKLLAEKKGGSYVSRDSSQSSTAGVSREGE